MKYLDVQWGTFIREGARVEVVRDCGSGPFRLGSYPNPEGWGRLFFEALPGQAGTLISVVREDEDPECGVSTLCSVTVKFDEIEGYVVMDGHCATFLRPPAEDPWWKAVDEDHNDAGNRE